MCDPGFADCNNNPADGCEVATNTDLANCGGCGMACQPSNATGVCVAGACQVATCNAGFGNCDGMASNGCELPLTADPMNCGMCRRTCMTPNGMSACVMGNCAVASCSTGFADCNMMSADGCEIQTATDPTNCGACGRGCTVPNATPACATGTCAVGTCNTNFANCNGMTADGCEINLATDVNNCGACNNRCTTANGTPGCASRACTVAACNTGFANCNGIVGDGCEVNTTNDVNNCGACTRRCTLPNATSVCTASNCAIMACTAGFYDVNATAADGCECQEDATSQTCASPTNAGALNAGGSVVLPSATGLGKVVTAGGSDWYVITFSQNSDFMQHGTGTPAISFAANQNSEFRFEVRTNCTTVANCGTAVGTATGLTSWSFVDNASGALSNLNYSTRMVSWPSVIYVRVYRANQTTQSCSGYQLRVTR
jgi:hypothetical protein